MSLARLGLLFVLVPALELFLLIRIGEWLGIWSTLLLILTTGAVGAALARAEGMRVLVRFQQEMLAGRLPGQALQDGISVLVGGAFLVTPGILTDLAGLALLFPPTRRLIQRRVRRSLERRIREGTVRVVVGGPGGFRAGGGGLDPDKEIRVDPPAS